MNQIDQLIYEYEEFASLPWDDSLAGPQRVWFAVYDKHEERRLRLRIDDFKLATQRAGHGWALYDLTDQFAHWMGAHKYREAYFAAPRKLDIALKDFKSKTADAVKAVLKSSDETAVVALQGVGSLFGIIRASELICKIQNAIPGRLLVFFPGEHANNGYRLLDAHADWNYLAVPITAYKRG